MVNRIYSYYFNKLETCIRNIFNKLVNKYRYCRNRGMFKMNKIDNMNVGSLHRYKNYTKKHVF